MMKRLSFVLILAIQSVMLFAQGKVTLPAFFNEGMVLQRDVKVPVWGWAEPGSVVKVEFNGKSAKSDVGADGTWKVYLPKMKACAEPRTLKVYVKGAKGSANSSSFVLSASFKNILVGDVFLCSGQSNMELPIRRCMDRVADLVKDYSNDQIRYLKFPHQYNYIRPNDNVRTLKWQNITPQNSAEVSGICYFMARELQEEKRVPIGIINSAVGGTRIEAWMPKEVLKTFPAYAKEFDAPKYNQVNWVDSVNRAEMMAFVKWERDMMSADTVVNTWRSPNYDFSTWQKANIFSRWFKGNGSYWFRFTVNVDELDAAKAAVLRMGAMKDADTIFVNGKYVGNTTYEYPPRIYKVPEGLLRKDENEIMVHLMSQSGPANFTSGKLYQLEVGDHIYKVSEEAQMCIGKQMPRRPSSTYFVDCPTGLYNAMIAPLRDFQFKGILWYQGESNLGTKDYAMYLVNMVDSWRKQFRTPLPIVVMQLPGYMSRHTEPVKESGWCDIREQQRLATRILSRAALATTLDTGEWNDIHPQDKQVAGHRAALQMRKIAYGEKALESEGPRALSAKRQFDGSIVVHFTDGQTKVVNESTVTWSIVGDRLRYCYDDFPVPEIFSKGGIPTPQFEIPITE